MRRPLLASSLAVCLVAMATFAQDTDRARKIAEIEKQIAELKVKLAALKKPAPAAPALPDSWSKALKWRCIGPASMGGRIVSFAMCPTDPSMWWVATASGGLLRTTNNGVTFDHQFDREATVSVGDVAVAPSDKNIVWVGTGENNPRNSVSYGDGVYKSNDGGKTWKNMGLTRSFQVGKILIHPTQPDVVYVGALGRLYGPSEERGLYKTEDGGKTWKKILHIDNSTGVIDMRMHPTKPDTILVATWERQRDAFDSHSGSLAARSNPAAKVDPPLADGYDAYDPIRKWGKGSGLYRTTDGGKTFKKVTRGLPSCHMGRIGLDWFVKDPNVVFALIDSEKTGMGQTPGYLGVTLAADARGVKLESVGKASPADRAGLKAGDVVTALNGKPVKTVAEFTALMGAIKAGSKVALSLLRGDKAMKIEATLGERPVQGRPARQDFRGEDSKQGPRLTVVLERGPTSRAGLRPGDIITAIDGKAVATIKAFSDRLRAARSTDKLKIAFLRGKERKEAVWSRASRRSATRPWAGQLGGQRENVQDNQGPDSKEYGGLYRSADAGESWIRVNSINPRPMYFSQVRVDPNDEKKIYVLGIRLHISTDGGKRFVSNGRGLCHDDGHALWIDPRDGRHLILGTDGGVYVSYDSGTTWDYLNTRAIAQFYHVCVDTKTPYNVYGGLQDNGSWGGPSRTLDGKGPVNSDWRLILGGDGFVCRVDPRDPDVVYAESQDGNTTRRDLRTGERGFLKPRAGKGDGVFRFNWNTPFLLSHHNSRIYYSAGNRVFRSVNRGDGARPISPELCKSGKASATALAESPRSPGILWAGTDDGQLWVTRNGGEKWENVAARIGLPRPFCVATIEPSRTVDGRAYVCFDGHRSDNDAPWLYVTEDFGQTWKSLRGNLPAGSSRCLREDIANPDVLYLGTEFAVWASIDRGATWTRINNNLPTVAVHELAQHPTAGEIVAATHGRSVWILDVTPLRQLKPATVKAAATLLAPNEVTRWRTEPPRRTIYGYGSREFFGENPEPGAHVFYVLGKKAAKVSLTVQDFAGRTLATLKASNEPGLHEATWNLRGVAGGAKGESFFSLERVLGAAQRARAPAPAGTYRIVLKVDGVESVQGLRLHSDPTLPAGTPLAEPLAEKEEEED